MRTIFCLMVLLQGCSAVGLGADNEISQVTAAYSVARSSPLSDLEAAVSLGHDTYHGEICVGKLNYGDLRRINEYVSGGEFTKHEDFDEDSVSVLISWPNGRKLAVDAFDIYWNFIGDPMKIDSDTSRHIDASIVGAIRSNECRVIQPKYYY